MEKLWARRGEGRGGGAESELSAARAEVPTPYSRDHAGVVQLCDALGIQRKEPHGTGAAERRDQAEADSSRLAARGLPAPAWRTQAAVPDHGPDRRRVGVAGQRDPG